MKRIVVLVLVVMAALFAARYVSAENAPNKFGYIDFQRALNEVEEGKKAKSMLKGEFDEKQKKLDAVQNELQAMKADLDKQRLILSADALKTKEEEYRKKFLELQQKLSTYEQEIKGKEAKLTSDILVVVNSIARNIGEKEGYTMILEKSQDVVIYSPTDADLTGRVIKEYNGMSKGQRDSVVKSYTK